MQAIHFVYKCKAATKKRKNFNFRRVGGKCAFSRELLRRVVEADCEDHRGPEVSGCDGGVGQEMALCLL